MSRFSGALLVWTGLMPLVAKPGRHRSATSRRSTLGRRSSRRPLQLLSAAHLGASRWPCRPHGRSASTLARLQENLRVVAAGAADRVREFWNQRQR